MSAPQIVAVLATCGRPRELARLLDSLAKSTLPLLGGVMVDNGNDTATREIAARSFPQMEYIGAERNLGCGGGLRRAEELAFKRFGDRLTHLLVLDDDAVVPPDALAGLADAMERERAAVAYPLVIAPDGSVGWLPGLADRRLHALHHTPMRPEEYRNRLGAPVADFVWAQGICLLITREAIEACGFHRDDFWVRGEDLEFSLRLTARFRGIFVPTVEVQHLPPRGADTNADETEYLRHAALVQNVAYVGLRLLHGRRIAWTLFGTIRRFLALWGLRAIGDAAGALWRGAVRGEPAGADGHGTFLARFNRIAK